MLMDGVVNSWPMCLQAQRDSGGGDVIDASFRATLTVKRQAWRLWDYILISFTSTSWPWSRWLRSDWPKTMWPSTFGVTWVLPWWTESLHLRGRGLGFFCDFFSEKKQLTFLNIKNLEVSLGRPGYTWIQSWRHPISTSQIWKERMCPYTLPGEYRKSKRIQTPDTTLLGITTNGSCTSHVIWSNAPSRAFQWSTPFMWRMASKLEMFWRRSWLKAGKSFLWSQLTWAFSVPEWSMAPRRRDKELISRINDEVSGTERSQPFFQHGILCWLNFWSFLWQELSLENPLEKESEVKRRIFWTTLSHCCSMRQKISNKKSPWEAKRH